MAFTGHGLTRCFHKRGGKTVRESMGMKTTLPNRFSSGKIGWLFLWLIGIPVPVLLVLFLLRGCT